MSVASVDGTVVKVEVKENVITNTDSKVKVAILGATGTVGQRFIQLLENHPWFTVALVAASERSAGKQYGKVVKWKLPSTVPSVAANLTLVPCDASLPAFRDCPVIFSALDSSVAGPVEVQFAKAGHQVFSNAKNHRMDADVPILIPHVNPEHIAALKHQSNTHGYPTGSFIATNANCASTGLAIALKPIHDAFRIKRLFVVTLQAISGAGYPGVASLDIVDNVVPFISDEEPKLESESLKILGRVSDDGKTFVHEKFGISAHANRVNVIDGHTECLSIELEKPATPAEVEAVLRNYLSEAQELKLPSAPAHPILVHDADAARPQPRLDRDYGNGYVVTVGRVRQDPLFTVKMAICSHNTIIGAAGGSILNAELCYAKGLVSGSK